MNALELDKMEQVKGGFDECTGEVLATVVLAAASIPFGPFLTAAAGAYQGHELYHACFQ